MSGKFSIFAGSGHDAAPDLAATVAELQIEENIDLPGAIEMTLPVKRGADSDLDTIDDPRLGPFANICVTAAAADGVVQCLFDGYVLSHKLHLDTGVVASSLKVWGQDASWLMDIEEKTQDWQTTDGAIANAIFANYGFAADPSNLDDDTISHDEQPHSLMQRGTDAQLLATLARRGGKFCRVFCTDTPGRRTGWFASPDLSAAPSVTLTLNDASSATVDAVELEWDVMRPTNVLARSATLADTDPDGIGGATTDSGLAPLADQDLAAFGGQTLTALLTAPADDAATLDARAQAVLRDAGWFVTCRGTADAGRVGSILRAGTIVALAAAGAMHSGNYLVWSVKHTISALSHRMEFRLVRNALGAPPPAGPLPGAAAS